MGPSTHRSNELIEPDVKQEALDKQSRKLGTYVKKRKKATNVTAKKKKRRK